MAADSIARILLVEDDPTTSAFLVTAARGVPAEVDAVGDCAGARLRARAGGHDLWLVDANLPDGDGAGLLAWLRARGLRTPALAHTADGDPAVAAALRAAGFLDVLVKPITISGLQLAVRSTLGIGTAHVAPRVAEVAPFAGTWDDTTALAALNGERAHVEALRRLFLAELPAIRDAVRDAVLAGDDDALRAALHRLRASCGFVGAARLAGAVVALQAAPASGSALAGFLDAAQDALSSSASGA
ncbi:MAG TPA: response regulator [Luteimonas sp.]|nr:response regulator [Luteimonas sp.]